MTHLDDVNVDLVEPEGGEGIGELLEDRGDDLAVREGSQETRQLGSVRSVCRIAERTYQGPHHVA